LGDSARGSYDWDPKYLEETVSWPRLIPPPDATTTSASITTGRAEQKEKEEVAVELKLSFPDNLSIWGEILL
jgi:hypothetical protein